MILSGAFQQAILGIEQAQARENFVRRLFANAAGVVEDQAGVFGRIHLAVAAAQQHAGDFFGVVIVHLAAEGLDVKGRSRMRRPAPRSGRRGAGQSFQRNVN